MFTLQDIQSQLAALFGGGSGATSFAAPSTGAPQVNGNNAVFSPNLGAGAVTPESGFGMNLGTAGAALGGLNAIGGFLQGNKAMKLAKDQFKFQKDLANTNLNNSIKSYNTSLEDRLTARGAQQGDDPALTQERIDRNRLSR